MYERETLDVTILKNCLKVSCCSGKLSCGVLQYQIIGEVRNYLTCLSVIQ